MKIVIHPDESTVELSGILSADDTPVDGALVSAYRADPPNTIVTATDTDDSRLYTATVLAAGVEMVIDTTFDGMGLNLADKA
jgi:hypothetical protein